MILKLYNTLTRRKETFCPLVPGKAGIYTCGPTVYADAHVGNLRSYVFPDNLKYLLRRLGFRVTHVVNITDVGHLTSDEDSGEDKMERAAAMEGRTAWDIAREHTEHFLNDLRRLRIDLPDVLPKATDHIPEQITLIQRLEAAKATYITEDGVYFDTARFPHYGVLARIQVEGLQEGQRVRMGGKRNKTDFALWKFTPPGVNRQMEWDSPWGLGFPGWHVECSAMSMKYLGESFDIHTGGSDHIPIHHTNEIAQSEVATGRTFVRTWLHGEFLILGEDQRMGKSEGNFITLQTVVDRGFDPLAFRYLVLTTHYRKFLNFSWKALQAADTALLGLRAQIRAALHDTSGKGEDALEDAGRAALEAVPAGILAPESREAAVLRELCDDLNTPKALAVLWTAFRDDTVSAAERVALAAFAEQLLALGLFDFTRLAVPLEVPTAVRKLANQRLAARQAKDWEASDRLREALAEAGFRVRDKTDGYELVPLQPQREKRGMQCFQGKQPLYPIGEW